MVAVEVGICVDKIDVCKVKQVVFSDRRQASQRKGSFDRFELNTVSTRRQDLYCRSLML